MVSVRECNAHNTEKAIVLTRYSYVRNQNYQSQVFTHKIRKKFRFY